MDGDWGEWLPYLEIDGNLDVGRDTTTGGNASVTGNITTPADVTAGSISLKNHTHSGVQSGPGNTGRPQ
jgi:hypothetical protein